MNNFLRSILVLMTGTAMSQLIPIIASPLLTRIFSPENFGSFAFYLSIITIASTVVTGKYEQAIPLPKSNRSASYLTALSLVNSCIITLILFVIAFGIYAFNPLFFNNYSLNFHSLLFITLGTLALASYQAISYWFIRTQSYKMMSKNKVMQAILNVVISILSGLTLSANTGLVLGDITSKIFTTFSFINSFLKSKVNSLTRPVPIKLKVALLIITATKYKSYPLYLVPGSLMNVLSKQLPFIIYGFIYSHELIGLLMMAQRVILSPLGIISSSFSQVLLKTTADQLRDHGNCWKSYSKCLKILVLIPLPIILLGYFFLEPTINLVFGSQWSNLSNVIFILTPYFYIYLVSGTLNIVVIAAGKQKLNLIMQSIFLLTIVVALSISLFFNLDGMNALKILTTANVFYFSLTLIISSLIAKGKL